MAKDVKVVINLVTAAGHQGFGMPLIMASKASKATPYTVCSSLDDVAAAGFKDDSSAVYQAAKLLFMQTDAPAQIAVCSSEDTAVNALAAIWDKDWRHLIVTSIGKAGESTRKEISDYVEACKDGMFFCSVENLDDAEDLMGNERTVCLYYTNGDWKNPEAALVGATAGLDVGSFTYKNMILKGLTPMVMKDADIESVHKHGAITFVTKAGDNVTTEGKTASGEYIDIVDSKDYIIQSIEYRCQKTMNTLPKLPYDNTGIATLEAEVLSVLVDAFNNGIIGTNVDGAPDYSVSFATRTQTAAADRAARVYNGGTFTFGLAGAIHNAEIVGEIIV